MLTDNVKRHVMDLSSQLVTFFVRCDSLSRYTSYTHEIQDLLQYEVSLGYHNKKV